MKTPAALILAFAFVIFSSVSHAADGVTAPGAQLEKLGDGYAFTEGPAVDAEGNVYFTDQPNDRILKWTEGKPIETFLQPCGRSNGMFFNKEGMLISCADDNNQIWSIDPKTGKETVLLKDYKGKLLNGPNDLWLRPDGGIYFTDPLYTRPYWKHRDKTMQQDGQHVYFMSPDRKKLFRVAEDFQQPNGIIGTPDGKTLYVADIRGKKTYSFDINQDGTLSNKKLFCDMGSDGMTVDAEGNVYLTGKGVTVFDKTGTQIERIDVPEGWTANVCFGGKDMQTLFITASKSAYGIKTRVKGVR